MDKTIIEGQSLGTIEKIIEQEVSKCEYWGDLELSYDELEILKNRIVIILSKDSVTIDYICDKYPHAITTFISYCLN